MVKKIVASGLLLTVPLFFLSFNLNYFSTNKLVLVVLATMILLITTVAQHLTTKKHLHQSSFFTLALGLFWAMMAINLLVTREGRVESIVAKGALFLTLPIITYALSTAKKSIQNLRWALTSLAIAGTALALHGMLQLVILANITTLPNWMQAVTFTPAGSPLILLTTLVLTFVATLTWSIKEKNLQKKTMLFTAACIQLAAHIAYGFMIARGEITIQLLPWKAGWPLTLDALKTTRELIFGIGFANFPVLFGQFKPSFLTNTALWDTTFKVSSNEAFHLLSTTGVLGFSTFVLLIISTIRNSLQMEKSSLNIAVQLTLYATILSFVVVPASIINYVFFFMLAGFIAAQNKNRVIKEINLPKYFSVISTVLLTSLTILMGYFTYRTYAAEVYMHRAQVAFTENKADAVYTNHIKAIKLMPSVVDYRISLSQINMVLGASLSQTQNVDPETDEPIEMTDEQRERISVLIQRAIEQGKIAVQLRPNLYTTWLNLGRIYNNLINVAQGSEEFAIQYLTQAIAKNPKDVSLRIKYGGLFYQLSELVEDEETRINLLDQAIQQFQVAAQLRPTHANAYYNLANALNKKGSYRLAYQAMVQTISNLNPDSTDYQQAQNELLELEAKLPKDKQLELTDAKNVEATASSELQAPEPFSSPLPGGPVELPEESSSSANPI